MCSDFGECVLTLENVFYNFGKRIPATPYRDYSADFGECVQLTHTHTYTYTHVAGIREMNTCGAWKFLFKK